MGRVPNSPLSLRGAPRSTTVRLVVVMLLLVASGGSAASTHNTSAGDVPSTAQLNTPELIGKAEGRLNLLTWQGYAEPEWVKPFEEQTGCQVHPTVVVSSDRMVSLAAEGGGGRYDLISATSSISLQLIYAGDVRPVNVGLIPDWKNFRAPFQKPAFNTVQGVHYGISLQWAPSVLLYNKRAFPSPPTSWKVIYDPLYRGKVTVPDSPFQIANAALYLAATQPQLGISNPYELTERQFAAVLALLKHQKPIIRRYWRQPSDEIAMFKTGEVDAGAAWPYQTNLLTALGVEAADVIPVEGTTGWVDSWMIAAKARHMNCAYLWMRFVSTPFVQAQQAIIYGETPVNARACSEMEKLRAGSCSQYRADAPSESLQTIKFWNTPMVSCGDGRRDCQPYASWKRAWTGIRQ